jgi:hypothetical protein
MGEFRGPIGELLARGLGAALLPMLAEPLTSA